MHRFGSSDSTPSHATFGFPAEAAAALAATVAALVWFCSRLSPDVAFGPWQGPLLANNPVYRLPVLMEWLAGALSFLPWSNPAWRLNLLTAAFGALACGALSAATTRAAQSLAGPVEAIAAGWAAGALFATSPLLTYASTGTTPATLTVFLGLTSLLSVCLWLGGRGSFAWMLLAAATAGLAAANHPAFGLLLFLVVGVYFEVPRLSRALAGIALLTGVFALAAAVPLAAAFARGESLTEFLSHALLTPYPNIADARPHLGFLGPLAEALSPLALLLAVPALAGFFRAGPRRYVLMASVLVLLMDPFLPFLTNQDIGLGEPVDLDAPRLMATAAVCLMAALGILVSVRFISSTMRTRPHRLALLLGITLVTLTLQVNRAPQRDHTVARELGRRILAGCPERALLVSGDPGLTSLVTATQRALGLRDDVDVLPVESLMRPHLRARLEQGLRGRIRLNERFPSDEALARWTREYPAVLEHMLHDSDDLARNPYARDLALWDLVLDNPSRWPVCFVGVDSEWLAARAQLSGPVVCYPRRAGRADAGFLDLVQRFADNEGPPIDPGIGPALADILIPASGLLRRQHGAEDARQVAELAILVGGDPARTRLALTRAAARQGDKDEAARHGTQYLAVTSATPRDREQLAQSIEAELRSEALREEFERMVELGRQGQPTTDIRADITRELWIDDDVATLAQGYSALADRDPDDVDALYQSAAALTQMGYLAEAQQRLSKAALANPSSIGQRLETDAGKFALLRAYHRHNNPLRFMTPGFS